MHTALAAGLGAIAFGATAAAQAPDPAAPTGNYGGGAVLAPPNALGAPGNMHVAFRVSGSRLRLNVGMGVRCGSGYLDDTATLGPDGAFGASGTITRRFSGGVRVRSAYEVSGTVTGTTASGTARLRNRIFRDGRLMRTCATGTVQWGARRPTGDLGAPGALAGARLYGTTAQRLEGPRRAIVMRVSSDASRLARALYEITLRCSSRRAAEVGYGSRSRSVIALYDAPRRNLPLRSDGTFSDVERFASRSESVVRRSTERFQGRLGMAGASGTFSFTVRLANRRSGRAIGTCRSGSVPWTAAV